MTNKLISKNTNLACYHCGDDCVQTTVWAGEKPFCCEGCKLVYEVLNTNELCTYYDLNSHPGLKQKLQLRQDRFAFLDLADLREQIIRFTDGAQSHVNFFIPQMHCSSCLWLLENIQKIDPGIVYSRVNFPNKEIFIVFNQSQTSLRRVVELLATIGYEPHLEFNNEQGKARPVANKLRVVKIGLAGFCFANIMMLSLPEYLAGGQIQEPLIKTVFTGLIVLLSLPVMLYTAQEFFISAWKSLRAKVINIDVPIALALLITYGRSLYEIGAGLGNGYMDSVSGIVFFMLIGRYIQDKSYQALSFDRNYRSFFPIAVNVLAKNQIIPTPIEKINKHDEIIIHNQEILPVDGEIIQGKGALDYSFVTGESAIVEKSVGDFVYAGAKQMGGSVHVKVQRPVSQSYLTSLWNRDVFQKDKQNKVRDIDVLSQYFSIFVLLLAVGAAGYWWVKDQPVLMWNALTTILIVACPCALLLAANFTNGHTLKILARNKFFIRHADVLENLPKTTHIVFDKTGTLTKNKDHIIEYQGQVLTPQQMLRIASLAKQSNHPLSQALTQYLAVQSSTTEVAHFRQVDGRGIEAWIDDHHLKMGSAQFLSLGAQEPSEDGSAIHIQEDKNYLGVFRVKHQYREGLQEVLQKLRSEYTLSVLSGDNDHQANVLAPHIGSHEDLFFNYSPEQKLDYIQQIQSKPSTRVLMIGDGLNDAGALKQSDVGVAVTENKNNFTPACDGILDGTMFHKLPDLLDFIKHSRTVIRLIFIYSVIYNIIGGYFALSGTLTPVIAAILMPASSLSIILLTFALTEWSGVRYGLNTDDYNH